MFFNFSYGERVMGQSRLKEYLTQVNKEFVHQERLNNVLVVWKR